MTAHPATGESLLQLMHQQPEQPRQGWAEAAKRAHENGDDELLIPDVFEDEKFEDWTW